MSDKLPSSDTRTGYVRSGAIIAHRFDNPSDADIRNLVEGYRTETEVTADAKSAFNIWWVGIDECVRLGMDRFSMWQAYKAGALSMARQLGHLPLSDAA